MPGLDGQADFNVLTLNYSNHLSFPTTWALALVAQKFTQASNCPLMVGLGDMAAFGEDGSKVPDNVPTPTRPESSSLLALLVLVQNYKY